MADTLLGTIQGAQSSDQSFVGSLANGTDTITIPTLGYATVTITAASVGANTLIVQVSNDGVNFRHSTLWKCGGSSAAPLGTGCTSITEDSTYIVLDCEGMSHVRVSISTFVSGTVTFTFRLSINPPAAVLGAVGTETQNFPTRSLLVAYRDATAIRGQRTPSTFKPINALNTNAEITAWTPAAGKKFRLMGMVLDGSVAGNYLFRDNTGGSNFFIFPDGEAGQPMFVDLKNGYLSTTANNVLTITGPATSTLSGTLWGTEE